MDRLRFCAWLLAGPAFAAHPMVVRAQSAPASASTASASVVDMAGRLRMLSQRMVKAYLMLGQGLAPDEARTLLQGSIAQFEDQRALIKASQSTAAVRSALTRLEAAWKPCKALLTAAPSKAGGAELYDASESLQQSAHSLTLACEQITGAPLDHLIGIAGRQRMLSQRMAKFYFYRTWGLFDAAADMELHLSRAHFTAVLVQIEGSQHATVPVKAGVAAVRREWEPYQQVLFANKEPAKMRRDAARVAELSERVLVVTEELVARLVAQVEGALTTARA